MCLIVVEKEYNSDDDYQDTKPLELKREKDVDRKVYSKKPLFESSDVFQPMKKLPVYSAPNKTKKSTEYSGGKVSKRKVSDSSLSSTGQVKRGPGRPKKVLKDDSSDNKNSNSDYGSKEKRLKLDCRSKMKQKTSNSSSLDLSPPVLEACNPFSPVKDSTSTPPTLSPISSVAKLSDTQKSSDEEKFNKKKIAKKRSTSSVLVQTFFFFF